jgi:hypothetical protein
LFRRKLEITNQAKEPQATAIKRVSGFINVGDRVLNRAINRVHSDLPISIKEVNDRRASRLSEGMDFGTHAHSSFPRPVSISMETHF